MTAVAILERDTILTRVANGDMLDDVANDLGIAAPNISKHLADDPDYKTARESGVERRLYRSRSALAELAQESEVVRLGKAHGNLARVRAEVLSADQWFAEREFRSRFGQHQHIEHSGSVSGPSFVVVIAPQQSQSSIEHNLADSDKVVSDQ